MKHSADAANKKTGSGASENTSNQTDYTLVENTMGSAHRETPENVPVLLAEIRNGNADAFAALSDIYAPLIDSMAHRFAPTMGITDTAIGPGGFGFEELRQDASMALYKAALRYDPDDEKKGKNVSFGLFAKICIRNALISELRKVERKKRKWEQQKKNVSHENAVPEERIAEDAVTRFRSVLSPYEYTVFALYITGKPPREISVDLGKTEKSVSNAIYRSKAKIKGMLARKSDTQE